jgi:hypothetical protein
MVQHGLPSRSMDPSKDFMTPIVFAYDETHLQKGGKAASWPLLFTTSILNQKSRNLPIAWRTIGYINDLSLIQSSAEDKKLSKELKAERLHAIFKTLLASIIKAQESGALDDIPITYAGRRQDLLHYLSLLEQIASFMS